MFKEEHVSESGVQYVGVIVGHTDQVESLLSAVPTTPERHLALVLPRHPRVALDGQQVQSHPVVSK